MPCSRSRTACWWTSSRSRAIRMRSLSCRTISRWRRSRMRRTGSSMGAQRRVLLSSSLARYQHAHIPISLNAIYALTNSECVISFRKAGLVPMKGSPALWGSAVMGRGWERRVMHRRPATPRPAGGCLVHAYLLVDTSDTILQVLYALVVLLLPVQSCSWIQNHYHPEVCAKVPLHCHSVYRLVLTSTRQPFFKPAIDSTSLSNNYVFEHGFRRAYRNCCS
jgi:hypothetical protein